MIPSNNLMFSRDFHFRQSASTYRRSQYLACLYQVWMIQTGCFQPKLNYFVLVIPSLGMISLLPLSCIIFKQGEITGSHSNITSLIRRFEPHVCNCLINMATKNVPVTLKYIQSVYNENPHALAALKFWS